ncbi:hypothetical protein CRUP_025714 [Coryphaenoides rupestris]|nr:hypothetical protein CRUP_025714 [Coryphaenoides rupestris]
MEVESADVIRLIMQYLQENHLYRTLSALQEETTVSLNTVESIDSFIDDVNRGHWDSVLLAIESLKLPQDTLVDLYEQTDPLLQLKRNQPGRFRHLESLLTRDYFDPREAYPSGSGKAKRRRAIAQSLAREVSVVPPSRLMGLLGQVGTGAAGLASPRDSAALSSAAPLVPEAAEPARPPGSRRSPRRLLLLHTTTSSSSSTAASDAEKTQGEEESFIPTQLYRNFKVGQRSRVACACFSPDGRFLVTGSAGGVVEAWDFRTGRISRVWTVLSGLCLRRFERAHSKGVTCLKFSKDSNHILSSSFDRTIRIHELCSGRTLRELRGHSSAVTDVSFTADGRHILSGSADATVKIWNTKTSSCLRTVSSQPGGGPDPPPVHSVLPLPQHPELFLVCTHSSTLAVLNLQGQTVRTLSPRRSGTQGGPFVCCSLSPRGERPVLPGRGPAALLLPSGHRTPGETFTNLIAAFSEDGQLRLWTP